MAAAIAYDTVRLFLGALAATPRGIDRVDLAYARFFFEKWPGDCVGTLPTPWGVRWYGRQRVLNGLDRLQKLWSDSVQPHEDRVLRHIKGRLGGRLDPAEGGPREDRGGVVSRGSRFLELLSVTGLSLGDSVIRSVPRNAIYLNVGQDSLAIPRIVSWLKRRPDVKSVFMLHDLIPLEHPDLVSGWAQRIHRRLVDRTARHASGLIVSTAAVRKAALDALRLRGRPTIPIETAPLPVSPVFLEREGPDRELRGRDYFVMCGAIEPRKNHRMVLDVWDELVSLRGERTPKLVVVGSPGWGTFGPALRRLQRSRPLQEHVIFASGLSSPALRPLMAHAKALLMPSLAEGFGLPVIEALAVGTPVIASDLPAHREIAGDLAVYRHPNDKPGWLKEICMFADDDGAAADIRKRVATYRPVTWREYFPRIERFLRTFEQP